MVWNSQHGFTKRKSCLGNLIAIRDELFRVVDEARATGVIYLDFGEAAKSPTMLLYPRRNVAVWMGGQKARGMAGLRGCLLELQLSSQVQLQIG